MAESDTATVECPLCGEAFDPTAAGGWCTNSECGEWQHEADEASDQQDGSSENDGASGDDALDDAADDAADVEGDADADGASDDETADEVPDDAESGEVAAAESDDVAEGDDAAEAADAAEADAADDVAASGTFDCPGCGATLDADVNFCPDCGEDVSDYPDAAESDGLDACPSCGADVDDDDNFCVSCGEDLATHRGGDVDQCPDCGANVDEDDTFCAGCGADLSGHGSGGAGGSDGDAAPDALALRTHGKSVVVGDGDAVGREIRSLLTEAGRPEDEAVRVHREHVRFVREGGQFYVVALGQNPTRVNGTSLATGDREPVAPGDEVELSDVVTLSVEAP